ncbi:MAG: 7-cyano-7-deazaguanine synthase [Waterburya sp.]
MSLQKSVVVLSGGQDSATTLVVASKESQVVGAVHFNYGQRHSIERECAVYWCSEIYDIPLEVIDIPAFAQIGNSALVGEGDVADQHPSLKQLPASFVPGRNLVFLTLAAAYAMKVGASQIWTGVCQTDYSGLRA